jgi:hypothetical protein
LMFSLLQVSFQGFLQCSILFLPRVHCLSLFAFKAVAQTNIGFWGEVSESKPYTPSLRLVSCDLMALNVTFAIVTASLAIQVVVLFLLVYGYLLKRRLKFRQHGITMSVAVFVHLTAVFVIMVPSFVRAVLPEYIVVRPFELASLVSLFHIVFGGLAVSLGIWRVASWRFRKNLAGCFNKKGFMRSTIIIWLAALGFGITLYTIFNWTILMG